MTTSAPNQSKASAEIGEGGRLRPRAEAAQSNSETDGAQYQWTESLHQTAFCISIACMGKLGSRPMAWSCIGCLASNRLRDRVERAKDAVTHTFKSGAN
jgi:hypothetical protein